MKCAYFMMAAGAAHGEKMCLSLFVYGVNSKEKDSEGNYDVE